MSDSTNWSGGKFLEAFLKNPWVHSAIKIKAESTASAKLRLFRRTKDGKEEVFNHPAINLMQRPNQFMTRFEFMELISMFADLVGESFFLIENPKLKQGRLIPLFPQNVSIKKDARHFVKKYVYDIGDGQTLEFDPDQILHFRETNPSDFWRGASALKSIATTFDADNYAKEWNAKFFQNNTMPAGFLSPDEPMDKANWEHFKNKFSSMYRGVKNAHKLSILNRKFNLLSTNKTQKDFDFAQLQDKNMREILATFRVPKSVLGISEDVNRANAEASEYTFQKNSILPRLRRIEERLNLDFLMIFQGAENLFFEFDDPTPANAELIMKKRESDSKLGARTINELREEDGREAVEGGDQTLVSYSLIPLVESQNSEKIDDEKGLSPKIIQKVSKESVKKAYLKRFTSHENRLKKRLQADFVRQERAVLKKIKDNFKSVDLDKLNIDKKAEQKIFEAVYAPMFLALAVSEAETALVELNITRVFSPSSRLRKELKKQAQRFAVEVNKTTYKFLKKELSAGIAEGEGEVDLGNRVKKIFKNRKSFQAKMIARTETNCASNAGHVDAYKKVGIKKIEWLSAEDSRTRPAHAEADGQVIECGGSFDIGGEKLRYPSDRNGSARNVINCRCRTVAVVE